MQQKLSNSTKCTREPTLGEFPNQKGPMPPCGGSATNVDLYPRISGNPVPTNRRPPRLFFYVTSLPPALWTFEPSSGACETASKLASFTVYIYIYVCVCIYTGAKDIVATSSTDYSQLLPVLLRFATLMFLGPNEGQLSERTA